MQATKVCPNCHQSTSSEMIFCGRCGYNFQPQLAPENIAALPGSSPAYPPSYAAPPAGAPISAPVDTTGYVIGSVLMMLLSLAFLPPSLGAGAIYCGYKVKAAGKDGLGIGLMVVSAGFMLIGIIVGVMMGVRRFSHM